MFFSKKALNPHETFAKVSIPKTGTPYALPASSGEQVQTARNLFQSGFGLFRFEMDSVFSDGLKLDTSFHTRIVQNNRDIAFGFVHIRHVDFLAFEFCFDNGFQRGNISGEAEFFVVCGNKFDRFFMK